MKIDKVITSGKFRLDGGEWDVNNNVYIIGDASAVYIVDPAHELDAIEDAVAKRPVRGILLTHAHNDHCELAPAAAERFGAEVYLHPDDAPLWEEANGDAPFVPLSDNEQFQVSGEAITVFHTPGHTPGGVVFHLPTEKALLSGDTLFKGGPGATGRKYSDFDVIIESLRNVIFHLPPATRVLPGHGEKTTVGEEAAHIDENVKRGY